MGVYVMITIRDAARDKNFTVGFFSDTVYTTPFKYCTIIYIWIYTFTSISLTVAHFQRRWKVWKENRRQVFMCWMRVYLTVCC